MIFITAVEEPVSFNTDRIIYVNLSNGYRFILRLLNEPNGTRVTTELNNVSYSYGKTTQYCSLEICGDFNEIVKQNDAHKNHGMLQVLIDGKPVTFIEWLRYGDDKLNSKGCITSAEQIDRYILHANESSYSDTDEEPSFIVNVLEWEEYDEHFDREYNHVILTMTDGSYVHFLDLGGRVVVKRYETELPETVIKDYYLLLSVPSGLRTDNRLCIGDSGRINVVLPGVCLLTLLEWGSEGLKLSDGVINEVKIQLEL
jgi:hypothetical protein